MVKKYLKSNKGSTLILVLMTLTVLSILGTAIIGLSVINYKMKVVDKNVKTSFYFAEAGLEEAYAVIGKEIETAIEKGNENVKNKLNSVIQGYRSDEASDPLVDDNAVINGTDGLGSVNERALKPIIEKLFREGYVNYINGIEGDMEFVGLKAKIESAVYNTVEASIDSSAPVISVIGSPVPFTADNDEYEIALQSEYTYNNITKIVKGTFKIGIPSQNSPYYVKNIVVRLNENVLWTKPITTDKNIYVLGDDVSIKGDIYAYGFDEGGVKGGIIVGNNGETGKLTVKGNVATNGFLHTNSNNSEIDVTGDIYCNSLAVQENTTGCSIEVKDGAVNTYDDIELNGAKAKIEIDGPYYGFSDGSSAVVHDMSSSIVINSNDLGSDGSTIRITGAKVEQDNNPLNQNIGTYLDENAGVYIGGTVYVNLDNPSQKYQTGESVSIKGNYKAYSEKLSDDPSKVSSRGEKFDPDNIVMGSFPPLVLISELNGQTPNVIDKSKYFNYYQADYGDLNLGNNGIEISNLKYSAGAYISGTIIDENIANDLFLTKYSNGKSKDYKFFVKKMGDMGVHEGKPDEIPDSDNSRVYINDRFSFGADITPHVNNHEFICVNSSPTKDIIVTGKDGKTSSELGLTGAYENIDIGSANTNGIIITRGDVYLTGAINYRGIIVAEGNVYIVDNEKKVIKNVYSSLEDRQYIYETMYENTNLLSSFANGVEREFQLEFEAEEADVKSYLKFEDIVDIEWEKVK